MLSYGSRGPLGSLSEWVSRMPGDPSLHVIAEDACGARKDRAGDEMRREAA